MERKGKAMILLVSLAIIGTGIIKYCNNKELQLPLPKDTYVLEEGYAHEEYYYRIRLAEYYDRAKVFEYRIIEALKDQPNPHRVKIGRYEDGEFYVDVDSFTGEFWREVTINHPELDSLYPLAIQRWKKD